MSENCSYCKDKKKVPTDLHAETVASWQPCPNCKPEEYKAFWDSPKDEDRLNWFAETKNSVTTSH